MTGDARDIDYRFSLANERTFLAWIRTSLALVAGGVAAAKALHFDHDVWRWIVAIPPILAGALIAAHATRQWQRYDDAMRADRRLPVGPSVKLIGFGLCAYALVALLASAFDG
jgi:putative membrane protein